MKEILTIVFRLTVSCLLAGLVIGCQAADRIGQPRWLQAQLGSCARRRCRSGCTISEDFE